MGRRVQTYPFPCHRKKMQSLSIPPYGIKVGLLVLFTIAFQCFRLGECAKSTGQVPSQYSSSSGATSSKSKILRGNEIVDIVGFGEDCSESDGILCDEIQNLVCDKSLELCVCDEENGFRHRSQVSGSLDDWVKSRKGDCFRPKITEENKNKASKNVEVKVKKTELDVVGYGEDCSLDEGPTCDAAQFLVCDNVEEICVCDHSRGYLHLSDVPGGEEQHEYYGQEGLPKSLCISKDQVANRAQELLLGSGGTHISNEQLELEQNSEEGIDIWDWEEPITETEGDPADALNVETIYGKMMNQYAPQVEVDSKKMEKLKYIMHQRETLDGNYDGNMLVANEIYKMTWMGKANLDFWTPKLQDLVKKYTAWQTNKLTDLICTGFYDLDKDTLSSAKEYVVTLLSEKVRELVMRRSFLDLIIPLSEETCVRIEDLMYQYVDQNALHKDFLTLDLNQDGCFSFDEYRVAMEEICNANWLEMFFELAGLNFAIKNLDPSPEEIYVRMLLQKDRLQETWRLIDENEDGFLSLEELAIDFSYGINAEAYLDDTADYDQVISNLFSRLDFDNNGLVSLEEIRRQMNIPRLTTNFEFAWLESLSTLYDSDEDYVKWSLDDLHNSYNELMSYYRPKEKKVEERLFEIFDKNENGEWDAVEFKLVMEMLTKYVVFGVLNQTVGTMDLDKNAKISIYEYQEFFYSSSSSFKTYLKNLVVLQQQVKELRDDPVDEDLGLGERIDDEEDLEDTEEDDDDGIETREKDGTVTYSISSSKLSKRAARANESMIIFKLFANMDENKDGFITKEDMYSVSNSATTKKSKAEATEEFKLLDMNNDGFITNDESPDVIDPMNLESFTAAQEAFSESVIKSDYEMQFLYLDVNKDNVISKTEFSAGNQLIFMRGEQGVFLSWLEEYLKNSSPGEIVDPLGEKAFRELDLDCNGLISPTEFKNKLDELRSNSHSFRSSGVTRITGSTDAYFNNLDLNRDGMISYNEFHLLLLRTNKKVNEF